MHLATALPHPELAGSGFCLADPGREYLVFIPQGSEVEVDLSATSGPMVAEWLLLGDVSSTSKESVVGRAKRKLKAPFTGQVVLYLYLAP